MKKVINGVLYNSDNAKQVGVYGHVTGGNVVKTETLYKTREGNYFILERDMAGGMGAASGRMIPLSAQQANDWAKKHLGEYPYAAEFKTGSQEEPREKTLPIALPSDLVHKLEQLQAAQGKTIAQIIESALDK